MKMRPPAIPLIAIDPYFSVWSKDALHSCKPFHWTGSPNAIRGLITVDGATRRFMGKNENESDAIPALPQVSMELDACSTAYVFADEQIRLTAVFTSPVLVEDLYYTSRPVSYLHLSAETLDGQPHDIRVHLAVSEELVLNKAGESRAISQNVSIPGVTARRMGNGVQKPLNRSGDDLRIDWGYFYLAVAGDAAVGEEVQDGCYCIYTDFSLEKERLIAFAYDDEYCLEYFHQPVVAYWKKDGKTIEAAIAEAFADYPTLFERCRDFSERLRREATEKGGEEYAELLSLAYRQVMGGHKLAIDPDGELLYISKECFSDGCAATVDVTYPSAPMYLKYNPQLLAAMLRPVFRFARSEEWKYDFAPHDVGTYPLVNGQTYWASYREYQMPVEECGNCIILMAALVDAPDCLPFVRENMDLLEQWKNYLAQYGEDPESQLCTDDFAGHLAHNCNLSLKAIYGLVGYARILERLGLLQPTAPIMETARRYAQSFLRRAANPDGSTRLAYDRPDTFSLKYNAVWDKLWHTELLPPSFFAGEIARYKREKLPYGVPLDSRERYTKSDWLLWVACTADNAADFQEIVHLLWLAYHTTHSRVPLSDWYWADTSEKQCFLHRTVQGGLFLRLLMD